jgi:ATP phosphoribosyltransferase
MRIAVPAGRLNAPSWAWLKQRGLAPSLGRPSGRRLWAAGTDLEVVTMRGRDIPDLLHQGVIETAIVGRDVLLEAERNLWSAGSLGFGQCRLVLALPVGKTWDPLRRWRVATRYPVVTRRWLESQGVEAEVMVLGGAVEAAPWLGVADAIVDVVETGRTLRENGLWAVETVLHSYATVAARAEAREDVLRWLGCGEEEGHAVGDA